jgi:4'-phosphopantetheinyl transferase
LTDGAIQVWRIRLDEIGDFEPTRGETARAARFESAEAARRYLRAHGALRAILRQHTGAKLDFAVLAGGKPWLPAAPELKFNLSRSRGMALVAVALETDVGVDVEHYRPLPEYSEIAERFFPPGEEIPAGEREFFHDWTRIEAMLKARGVGLYGSGKALEGEWTVAQIDAGEEYAAAAAATRAGMRVEVRDFGG